MEVDVRCRLTTGGHTCVVVIRDGVTRTDHVVSVGAQQLARLDPAPEFADAERLVRETFAFLLEREPKESILRSFDLSVVGRYFPEYEKAIQIRLAS